MQGVFAAILAPSTLGLLTTTFTDPAERGRALGVYGAIAGGGSALGLLLGGILTQTVSWRLCMFVNLALALPAAAAALRLIASRRPDRRPHIDVPGTVAASGGLFALVYGFSNAELHGCSASLTIAMLAAAAALLSGFVLVEWRVAEPSPAFFTATARVERADAGVASGMANTSQQVGGAIGAAGLSTIFATAVASYTHHHTLGAVTVHGYTTAFWIAPAIFATGAAIVAALIPNRGRLIATPPTDPQRRRARR